MIAVKKHWLIFKVFKLKWIHDVDVLHVVCGFQPNIILDFEAWEWIVNVYHSKIDIIEKLVHSLSFNNKVRIEQNGTFVIGWFNLTYCMQNMNSKSTSGVESVPTTQAEPCSSPWAWIRVAIVFNLVSILLFIISIVAICFTRSMSMKCKDYINGHAFETQGEKTCLS